MLLVLSNEAWMQKSLGTFCLFQFMETSSGYGCSFYCRKGGLVVHHEFVLMFVTLVFVLPIFFAVLTLLYIAVPSTHIIFVKVF